MISKGRRNSILISGWKIEKLSVRDDSRLTSVATAQPIEYWIITTTDDKGNKAVGGGIMKTQMPEHRVTDYVGVKSVDEYSAKVEKLGGKVIAPKHAVPGMGYFVLCNDTENNAFAIRETNEKAK
jgi:uncharacterized protein